MKPQKDNTVFTPSLKFSNTFVVNPIELKDELESEDEQNSERKSVFSPIEDFISLYQRVRPCASCSSHIGLRSSQECSCTDLSRMCSVSLVDCIQYSHLVLDQSKISNIEEIKEQLSPKKNEESFLKIEENLPHNDVDQCSHSFTNTSENIHFKSKRPASLCLNTLEKTNLVESDDEKTPLYPLPQEFSFNTKQKQSLPHISCHENITPNLEENTYEFGIDTHCTETSTESLKICLKDNNINSEYQKSEFDLVKVGDNEELQKCNKYKPSRNIFEDIVSTTNESPQCQSLETCHQNTSRFTNSDSQDTETYLNNNKSENLQIDLCEPNFQLHEESVHSDTFSKDKENSELCDSDRGKTASNSFYSKKELMLFMLKGLVKNALNDTMQSQFSIEAKALYHEVDETNIPTTSNVKSIAVVEADLATNKPQEIEDSFSCRHENVLNSETTNTEQQLPLLSPVLDIEPFLNSDLPSNIIPPKLSPILLAQHTTHRKTTTPDFHNGRTLHQGIFCSDNIISKQHKNSVIKQLNFEKNDLNHSFDSENDNSFNIDSENNEFNSIESPKNDLNKACSDGNDNKTRTFYQVNGDYNTNNFISNKYQTQNVPLINDSIGNISVIQEFAVNETEIKDSISNGSEMKDSIGNESEIKDFTGNELEINYSLCNQLEIKDSNGNEPEIKDGIGDELELKDSIDIELEILNHASNKIKVYNSDYDGSKEKDMDTAAKTNVSFNSSSTITDSHENNSKYKDIYENTSKDCASNISRFKVMGCCGNSLRVLDLNETDSETKFLKHNVTRDKDLKTNGACEKGSKDNATCDRDSKDNYDCGHALNMNDSLENDPLDTDNSFCDTNLKGYCNYLKEHNFHNDQLKVISCDNTLNLNHSADKYSKANDSSANDSKDNDFDGKETVTDSVDNELENNDSEVTDFDNKYSEITDLENNDSNIKDLELNNLAEKNTIKNNYDGNKSDFHPLEPEVDNCIDIALAFTGSVEVNNSNSIILKVNEMTDNIQNADEIPEDIHNADEITENSIENDSQMFDCGNSPQNIHDSNDLKWNSLINKDSLNSTTKQTDPKLNNFKDNNFKTDFIQRNDYELCEPTNNDFKNLVSFHRQMLNPNPSRDSVSLDVSTLDNKTHRNHSIMEYNTVAENISDDVVMQDNTNEGLVDYTETLEGQNECSQGNSFLKDNTSHIFGQNTFIKPIIRNYQNKPINQNEINEINDQVSIPNEDDTEAKKHLAKSQENHSDDSKKSAQFLTNDESFSVNLSKFTCSSTLFLKRRKQIRQKRNKMKTKNATLKSNGVCRRKKQKILHRETKGNNIRLKISTNRTSFVASYTVMIKSLKQMAIESLRRVGQLDQLFISKTPDAQASALKNSAKNISIIKNINVPKKITKYATHFSNFERSNKSIEASTNLPQITNNYFEENNDKLGSQSNKNYFSANNNLTEKESIDVMNITHFDSDAESTSTLSFSNVEENYFAQKISSELNVPRVELEPKEKEEHIGLELPPKFRYIKQNRNKNCKVAEYNRTETGNAISSLGIDEMVHSKDLSPSNKRNNDIDKGFMLKNCTLNEIYQEIEEVAPKNSELISETEHLKPLADYRDTINCSVNLDELEDSYKTTFNNKKGASDLLVTNMPSLGYRIQDSNSKNSISSNPNEIDEICVLNSERTAMQNITPEISFTLSDVQQVISPESMIRISDQTRDISKLHSKKTKSLPLEVLSNDDHSVTSENEEYGLIVAESNEIKEATESNCSSLSPTVEDLATKESSSTIHQDSLEAQQFLKSSHNLNLDSSSYNIKQKQYERNEDVDFLKRSNDLESNCSVKSHQDMNAYDKTHPTNLNTKNSSVIAHHTHLLNHSIPLDLSIQKYNSQLHENNKVHPIDLTKKNLSVQNTSENVIMPTEKYQMSDFLMDENRKTFKHNNSGNEKHFEESTETLEEPPSLLLSIYSNISPPISTSPTTTDDSICSKELLAQRLSVDTNTESLEAIGNESESNGYLNYSKDSEEQSNQQTQKEPRKSLVERYGNRGTRSTVSKEIFLDGLNTGIENIARKSIDPWQVDSDREGIVNTLPPKQMKSHTQSPIQFLNRQNCSPIVILDTTDEIVQFPSNSRSENLTKQIPTGLNQSNNSTPKLYSSLLLDKIRKQCKTRKVSEQNIDSDELFDSVENRGTGNQLNSLIDLTNEEEEDDDVISVSSNECLDISEEEIQQASATNVNQHDSIENTQDNVREENAPSNSAHQSEDTNNADKTPDISIEDSQIQIIDYTNKNRLYDLFIQNRKLILDRKLKNYSQGSSNVYCTDRNETELSNTQISNSFNSVIPQNRSVSVADNVENIFISKSKEIVSTARPTTKEVNELNISQNTDQASLNVNYTNSSVKPPESSRTSNEIPKHVNLNANNPPISNGVLNLSIPRHISSVLTHKNIQKDSENNDKGKVLNQFTQPRKADTPETNVSCPGLVPATVYGQIEQGFTSIKYSPQTMSSRDTPSRDEAYIRSPRIPETVSSGVNKHHEKLSNIQLNSDVPRHSDFFLDKREFLLNRQIPFSSQSSQSPQHKPAYGQQSSFIHRPMLSENMNNPAFRDRYASNKHYVNESLSMQRDQTHPTSTLQQHHAPRFPYKTQNSHAVFNNSATSPLANATLMTCKIQSALKLKLKRVYTESANVSLMPSQKNQPSLQQDVQPNAQPHVQSRVQQHVQPNAQTNAQPRVQSHVQSHVQQHVEPDAQACVQSHVRSRVQQHEELNAQPNVQSHVKSHVQPRVQPHEQSPVQQHVEPDAQPHVQSHVRSRVQPHVKSFAQPHLQSRVQPHVQSCIQSHVESHAKPQAQQCVQPNVRQHVQSHVESYKQSHVQPNAQPNVQPHEQPNVQPNAQPNVQSHVQPHEQPNVQPQGQSHNHPHAQSQVQPRVQSQLYRMYPYQQYLPTILETTGYQSAQNTSNDSYSVWDDSQRSSQSLPVHDKGVRMGMRLPTVVAGHVNQTKSYREKKHDNGRHPASTHISNISLSDNINVESKAKDHFVKVDSERALIVKEKLLHALENKCGKNSQESPVSELNNDQQNHDRIGKRQLPIPVMTEKNNYLVSTHREQGVTGPVLSIQTYDDSFENDTLSLTSSLQKRKLVQSNIQDKKQKIDIETSINSSKSNVDFNPDSSKHFISSYFSSVPCKANTASLSSDQMYRNASDTELCAAHGLLYLKSNTPQTINDLNISSGSTGFSIDNGSNNEQSNMGDNYEIMELVKQKQTRTRKRKSESAAKKRTHTKRSKKDISS